jgi:Flp pilus assembly pilin Flp
MRGGSFMLKKFLMDEDGMGTVELVLIIAALVAVALLFRNTIQTFVEDQMKGIFNKGDIKETIDTGSVYTPTNP